jgi:hypothetical protein
VPVIDQVAQALRRCGRRSWWRCPRVYEKLYAKILAATGVKRQLVLWARQVALDWASAVLGGDSIPAGLR